MRRTVYYGYDNSGTFRIKVVEQEGNENVEDLVEIKRSECQKISKLMQFGKRNEERVIETVDGRRGEVKRLIDPSPARAAAYAAFYPMLVQIARRHRYALAIHGSLHRDFDLIAVPWVEEASEPLVLVKAFKKATRTVVQHEETDRLIKDCSPSAKPHGRIAYSLHVTNHGMYGGYLDISVMPKRRTKDAK